jgi:hypothetical protein
VAVENAETPGREHQQAHSGEQDAHDLNRQRSRLPFEAGGDDVDEPRRRENAKEYDDGNDEAQEREDGARHPPCSLPVATRQEPGVHRNERRGEHTFPEEVLQQVGNAEARAEGIRGVR